MLNFFRKPIGAASVSERFPMAPNLAVGELAGIYRNSTRPAISAGDNKS